MAQSNVEHNMYFNHEKVGRDIEFDNYIPNLIVNAVGDIHSYIQYPYENYNRLLITQEGNPIGANQTNFYITCDDNLNVKIEFKEKKETKIRTMYEIVVIIHLAEAYRYDMGYIEKIEDIRSHFHELFLFMNQKINKFNAEFEKERFISREFNKITII